MLFVKPEIKEILVKLDTLLKEDIYKLDKILVLLAKTQKYRGYLLPTSADKFAHLLAYELFGNQAVGVLEAHKVLVENFAAARTFEPILREYFATIVKSRFVYNPVTGENNLLKISDRIIHALNHTFEKFSQNKDFLNIMLEDIRGDEQKLIMALVFFSINILVSGIALQRNLEKMKGGEKIISIISKIYYGYSLGFQQYLMLKQKGLLGGILFRGMYFHGQGCEKLALKVLSQRHIKKLAGSWTLDYFVAMDYTVATHDLNKFAFANSFEIAKECIDRKKDFVMDHVGLAREVLKYILNGESITRMEKWKTHKGVKEFPHVEGYGVDMVGLLLSTIVDKRSMMYIGERARSRADFSYEEEIPSSKKIKVDDHSVDVFVRFN